jgi:hypothetical protein
MAITERMQKYYRHMNYLGTVSKAQRDACRGNVQARGLDFLYEQALLLRMKRLSNGL